MLWAKLRAHVRALPDADAQSVPVAARWWCAVRTWGVEEQAAIRIWDAADWRAKGVLEGHKLTVTQLAFSPDDSRCTSCSLA